MLGYVRAYRPEMKFKDYDLYKGVYCSLCKAIGKRYGLIARLTLSYDFTFLAILRMAVRENKICMRKSRCSFNPMKKCYDCSGSSVDIAYTADVSMLTFYYKIKDNINDSRFFKKLLCKMLMPYANHIFKKAKRNNPVIAEKLGELMDEQARAEKRGAGVDEAADASAKMLAEMVSTDIESSDDKALRWLGYYLGRWVYLIDAVDDCEDDIKTGSFNPLKKRYNLPDFKEYCERMLSLTVGEAINNMNKLEIYRFYDIIDNVLNYGTECSAKRVIYKEVDRCEKSV
ncbi:MAG TPA: hypothetical protein DCY15_03115 [Ruminococcaceae bacterium]|nr:hypothetical protein [Oscillospiraceae bacterium]